MPLVVGAIPNIEKNALEGSRWIEFLTHVEPDDFPVAKKGMSAFTHSDLDFLLESLHVDTLDIDGILSECCVLNTAFDAANRRYKVVVVQDLTRGYSPETEAATLKIVSLHLGLVVDSSEIALMWGRDRKTRQERIETGR
jgi:nicotinamidase-related amidase